MADSSRGRGLILWRGLVLGLGGVVEPTDPLVFASCAALLLVIAVGSVVWPAWQASRTDPMVALRQ